MFGHESVKTAEFKSFIVYSCSYLLIEHGDAGFACSEVVEEEGEGWGGHEMVRQTRACMPPSACNLKFTAYII